VVSRPGTTQDAELPTGSKGLCTLNGELVVFSHTMLEDMPDGYRCEVVQHPDDPEQPIATIWFAGPYLGFLYVAAEFSGGDVFHYWLQGGDAWAADTAYSLGQLVEPTVRNGFVYQANRVGDPGLVWAPNVARTVGDVIEPTTPNGFKYECIDTLGANPRSGTSEPAWPTEDGATIAEDTDLIPPTTPTTASQSPDGSQLPDGVTDRYGHGLHQGFAGLLLRIVEDGE
jgi:hypothetical protein